MTRTRIFATCIFLGALASQLGGCLGLTAQQCTSSSECDTGLVCGGTGICVKPAAAGAGGPVVVAANGTGCTTTAACTAANGGNASICRNPGDPCIDLATADCPSVTAGWDNPNAIFLGSISQSNTQNVDDRYWGDAHEAGLSLAVSEVMANNGGIGGGTNGAKRPIVAIKCNLEAMKTDAERAADATRVVEHLNRDVKVASILVQDEHNMVPALQPVVNEQVFTMCSFCESTPVATTPANGLIWRGSAPFTDQAEFWNHIVQNLESRVRANAAYKVGGAGAVRVALAAAPSDEYVAGLAETVSSGIKWNGNKDLSANLANFLRTTNDSWEKSTSSATVYTAAQQIVAQAPHIVLMANDTEAIRTMIPLIESLWTSDQERPYYVLNNTAFHPHLPVLVGADESLRRRVVGVLVAADPESVSNFAGLATRVSAVLPPGRVADVNFVGAVAGPYDAAYSVILAIAASGVANPSGADIRVGMSRLIGPGPVINLNSSDFNSALAVLASGQNIDLLGTLTTLDWDLAAHTIRAGTAAFCVDRDTASGNALISGTLSPFQRRAGGTFVGDIGCF